MRWWRRCSQVWHRRTLCDAALVHARRPLRVDASLLFAHVAVGIVYRNARATPAGAHAPPAQVVLGLQIDGFGALRSLFLLRVVCLLFARGPAFAALHVPADEPG